MTFEIFTMAERPELHAVLREAPFDTSWPEFMNHDPTAGLYYGFTDEYAAYILLGLDDGEPVVGGWSVPFGLGGPGRERLPDGGWDQVIRWAHYDRVRGAERNACSALEINVLPGRRGTGLSALMLAAMRENAFRLGHSSLYAPVRPSGKSAEPETPMSEYAFRVRADGLPVDPWLRVHVRAGGRIVAVCPTTMTIPGTLADWREWTGLPFDVDGTVLVPGALSPVLVSVAQDSAVYVEPNVWIEHAR